MKAACVRRAGSCISPDPPRRPTGPRRRPNDVLHILHGHSSPHLPGHRESAATVSLGAHIGGTVLLLLAMGSVRSAQTMGRPSASSAVSLDHLVFVDRHSAESSGGGGGGNHQTAPIQRAASVGRDLLTMSVQKSASTAGQDSPTLQEVVLDAKPLASGAFSQVGLPTGGVPSGGSLGPGSGTGVDDGAGGGLGPGSGDGIGPGLDRGIGGQAYRAGGSVSSPRVLKEVKPAYTNRAMMAHLEGTVMLELIVGVNGLPSNIRVVKSIDPGGLDDEAVRAASQWRFEPGRLNGRPVDVLASLAIDFHIR
jgi:TonB family protein